MRCWVALCRRELKRLLCLLCLLPGLGNAQGVSGEAGFAGSQSCAECHKPQFDAWSSSYHALAMSEARPATVLGDFQDAEFGYAGASSRFSVRDGRYLVRTDGADGKLAEFPVTHTFGVYPLQQYLVPLGQGRLQALSIAWDSRSSAEGGQRWFHLYPDEAVDHADPLHWSGPYQRWNSRCAECHSTGLRKGFDAAGSSYLSEWAEISVGCESCHGRSAGHVAAARRGESLAPSVDPGRPGRWEFGAAAIAVPRSVSTIDEQLAVCAPCHSRRQNIGTLEPGERFLDRHVPSLLDQALYFPDGQIRDEVFEYGSFMQSRMAARGVVCSDCHDPHSARLNAEGDAVCSQCHLPARYAASTHHRHQAGSEGSQCVACHMPARVYMGVDARRDHRFGIPDPWLSEEAGTPNACVDCHDAQDNAWARKAMQDWGYSRRESSPATLLAVSRRPTPEGVHAARRLAGDRAAPLMQRATALAEMRLLDQADLQIAATALRDPQPLIRVAALRALAGVPAQHTQQLLWPMLRDPLKAVRLEATLALASLDENALTPAQRELRANAVAEYLAAQDAAADLAGGPLNRAALHIALGQAEPAEQAYRAALELEPHLIPAWLNLADLYRATQREQQSAEVLQRALELAPEDAAVQHAWGLHLVRSGRHAEALPVLQRAHEAAPENTRYGYVLAVGLNSAGRAQDALELAQELAAANPVDIGVRELLVALYRDSGQAAQASAAAAELQQLRQQLASPP
jgi:predicted CXXCH cytochrome family protein